MRDLIDLRHSLHRIAELSGQEKQTVAEVRSYVVQTGPSEIIDQLGGHGLAAVYRSGEPGPTIVFRCELDALPIEEPNTFSHRSVHPGVSHKCGHDGHMAILAGLGSFLRKSSSLKGQVVLLFQPAEETGQGALAVLRDAKWKKIRPGYCLSFHNIPGQPAHQIILPKGQFSAAVQSLAIDLKGTECHAAEPTEGRNPALAIARIIDAFAKCNQQEPNLPGYALCTPVFLTMGQKAYGTSAGSGSLHYTIRTWSDVDLQILCDELYATVAEICQDENLEFDIETFEHFPNTVNDPSLTALTQLAAADVGLSIVTQKHPFTFGEDFGWFSQNYPSLMFGLGAGTDTPPLHHPNYDFPDALIETGIHMLTGILKRLWQVSDG